MKRKTRFHDEKGNRVGARALMNAPAAFVTAAAKRLFGWRPRRPMISYTFTRWLGRRMRPDWTVVEFGAGMSTPWLAARCGRLITFEDSPEWAARVRAILGDMNLRNVEIHLRPGETYRDVAATLPDRSVDFALVDGADRDGCLKAILPKMKVGGLIYLDNSDKDMDRPGGSLRRAEAVLRTAAEAHGWPVRTYTDFAPTNFFAEQGMLVEVACAYEP